MLSRKFYKYTNVPVKFVQRTSESPIKLFRSCEISVKMFSNSVIVAKFFISSTFLFSISVQDIKFGTSFRIV